MSYTTQIKNEIVKREETKSELIATLSAFVRNNGYIEDNILFLTTENLAIKNKIVYSFETVYEISIQIKIKENLNFSKNSLYLLCIEQKLLFILNDLGFYDKTQQYLETPPEYIIGSNEEIRSYLRGVFLTQGSINDPKTSRYHMELLISKSSEAVFVQKLLNMFNLNAKILNRDKGYMIYIKEAEKISDFLKIIGAVKAVLYFEDIRIYHDKKNHTNRLNNCEQANIDKVVEAATIQLQNIKVLEENLATELLDDKTKEALEYRKKYPEASLKELSEIISMETGNKITKSGLNHRFRKINELAGTLTK
ncbi:MAG: DNA-binding protein WhiA [Bacilli bacterium]|nr:DNA-binding protein WhiA [Bacilli bacterium]